jgi:hypothetical protein
VSGSTVCVVIGSAPPDLSGQSVPVQERLAGPEALGRATAGDCEWLWLLAAGARPRPDALELLLEPAGDAAVVAGVVVDTAGRPVVEQLPAVSARSLEDLVRLVGRSLLPIRSTPFANVLVRRGCFVHHGLPDTRRYGRWAPLEWSAALLRDEAGYLVPRSVVELEQREEPPARLAESPAFARTVRSGALTRGDAVRAFRAWRGSG